MRAAVLALAVAVLPAPLTRADEESIPFDKLPKAVADGFKKRFPNAKPTGASKETTEDKKTVYEVTFKTDGKTTDVTLTEGGAVTTIEKEIGKADLPKAAAAALDKKYPKATYKIVEEVTKVADGKEAVAYYEALVETADGKQWEVEVLKDGTIKNVEEKKPEGKSERQ
ncbi:MAG: hypothetical protein K2X82_05385 [Gemmataceae bacterium]|nr:hypothetical protein [Gemmataceae bacterium]